MRLLRLILSGLFLAGAAATASAEEPSDASTKPLPLAERPPTSVSAGEGTATPGLPQRNDWNLAVGGFVQADAVIADQSSQDQLSSSGGQPLNNDRFLIRRARLSVEAHRRALGAVIELEGTTASGAALGMARAEVMLGWARPDRSFEMGLGLTRIPFGLEVQELHPDRFFLERSNVSRALFPGVRDLGARMQGAWRFLRAQFAVMNGNPLGDASFPARDPNAAKDFIGRLGVDATIAAKVRIRAGASSLKGTGFHAGTPATKDALFWRDQNEDGLVQLSEIQVIPGRAATASQNFSRFAVGADGHIGFALPRLGNSAIFGEVIWGTNLDRGLMPADPVASGRDLREFGWVVGLCQEFTSHAAFGIRYDFYNPDVDGYRQTPVAIVPKDTSLRTWTFALSWGGLGRNRLTLEYQHNHNSLAVAADGSPTTLAADMLTLRGQMVFQ